MLPVEIHDRGRGPEIKGTRLTVYDIISNRLDGDTPEQVLEILTGYHGLISAAHIEALYRYMDEHYEDVMAVHRKIEERNARGNPPEIEAKLAESRIRVRKKLEELRKRRTESPPMPLGPSSSDKPPA